VLNPNDFGTPFLLAASRWGRLLGEFDYRTCPGISRRCERLALPTIAVPAVGRSLFRAVEHMRPRTYRAGLLEPSCGDLKATLWQLTDDALMARKRLSLLSHQQAASH